jgi:hypothetical protein
MADDSGLGPADPTVDDAVRRFERAETALEETEDRRRAAIDEARRAASDLERVLDGSIAAAVAERDRLEDELAAVLDHLARLESMRGRREAIGRLAATVVPFDGGADPRADDGTPFAS